MNLITLNGKGSEMQITEIDQPMGAGLKTKRAALKKIRNQLKAKQQAGTITSNELSILSKVKAKLYNVNKALRKKAKLKAKKLAKIAAKRKTTFIIGSLIIGAGAFYLLKKRKGKR